MSEPATTRTSFPAIVRLLVYDKEDWFEISCEVCRTIVASGEKAIYAENFSTILAQVAIRHLHPGS